MNWFNYYTDGTLATSVTPPVRRLIVFPSLSDNLKAGDWIHCPLTDLNIGQLYFNVGPPINVSFDQDAFIVVYETATTKTPTYSYIDLEENLYFKSLTDVSSGSRPEGAYYIYYHSDNAQYIQLSSGNYIRTANPGGSNYMGTTSGSGVNVVDYYSHLVNKNSNIRIAKLSYFGDSEIWSDGKTNKPGAKILGTFDGPRLKIFADNFPDKGQINIKIIKTSATSSGQSVVYTQKNIDMYSVNQVLDTEIFNINLKTNSSVINLNSYDDCYGTFSFEIELLSSKNQSSGSTEMSITKYSFSKNYDLYFDKEQIDTSIVFTSTGVIR